jgi:hypothetical protein
MEPQDPTPPPAPTAPVVPAPITPVFQPSHPKWPGILGVLTLLLLVGGGGVFLGKQMAKPMPAPTPTPIVAVLPTPTPDPLSAWKTYQLNGAYSFKYPPQASIKNANERVTVEYWGPTQKEGTEISDGIYVQFEMIKLLKGDLQGYVADKIAAEAPLGRLLVPRTAITTSSGLSGFTYTHEGLGGNPKYIYLKQPNINSAVQITDFTVDPANVGYANTVSQILSTFRFENQTSGLKTYTSTFYKYSIQYPSTWETYAYGYKPADDPKDEPERFLGPVIINASTGNQTALELQKNSARNYTWENRKIEDITVDGLRGVKVTGDIQGNTNEFVVFGNDAFIYTIQGINSDVDLVLPTFRYAR